MYSIIENSARCDPFAEPRNSTEQFKVFSEAGEASPRSSDNIECLVPDHRQRRRPHPGPWTVSNASSRISVDTDRHSTDLRQRRMPRVAPNPGLPYFAKNINKLLFCGRTAVKPSLISFFVFVKNITNLHNIKIHNIFRKRMKFHVLPSWRLCAGTFFSSSLSDLNLEVLF